MYIDLNAALAENAVVTLTQQERLTEFVKTNSNEVFQYLGISFLIGLGVMLVAILISYGIFKSLSVFRNLINF